MSKTTGIIVTGRQIRAARSLLGWSQDELARAAGLHANAVARWEQTVAIPIGRRQPHACRKITEALSCAGVEFIGRVKSGARWRARHGVKHLLPPWAVLARTKTVPPIVASRKPASPCGARTRNGAPCQRRGLRNGRCTNHGGMSSGPKTSTGRGRIAEVQRKRWAAWRAHKCRESVVNLEP